MLETRTATMPALPSAVCPQHAWVEMAGGRLSRCDACGLVATARVPWFDYDQAYFTAAGAGGYDFDADYARDADAVRFGRELDRLERLAGRGTLLDIGCATGSFLCAAAARGWRVTGVEVAEYARVEAEARSGAPVVASCEELPAGGRFDVVTLHHVLEHLHDPVGFLRDAVAPRIARRLLVEVPNFHSLASRVQGGKWKDLRLEQHVCHYTPRTLRTVIESAGLDVERVYSLWEPLWSLRATVELGRLLAHGALGRDRRWDPDAVTDLQRTRDAFARYRRPTGLRRALTGATRVACRPAVAALEAAGLGTRLVAEAVPRGTR